MAAPTFVGVAAVSDGSGGGSATSASFNWDEVAGEADNDIAIMAIYKESTAAYTATPAGAGWAQVSGFPVDQDTGGFKYRVDVWWRRRSGDTGTVTWTWTGSAWRDYTCVVYRNAITSENPIISPTIEVETNQNNNPVHPGLTIGRSNSALVWIAASFADIASAAPPAGFAQRSDTLEDTRNLIWYDDLTTTTGASGTVTGNLSGDIEYPLSVLLELASEAVSGSVTVSPPMLTLTATLPAPVVTDTAHVVVSPPKLTLAATLRSPLVAVVQNGNAVFTATNGATITPTLPAGWLAGDLHVLYAARSDNTAMTDPGDRWTQLAGVTGNNTSAQRNEIWWRRAQAGDAAPVLTFGSGTTPRGAQIIGVRCGTPADAGPFVGESRSTDGATGTVVFATVTPSETETILLALYAYEDDPSAASTIADWQPFKVAPSALGSDMTLGYAWRVWPADDSATGALQTTVSGGSFSNASPNIGVLLAIQHTVAGVTVTPALVESTLTLLDASVSTAESLSATVTPDILPLAATLLDPTITAESALSATVEPPILLTSLTLPTATISAVQSATIAADLLTLTVTVLAPAISTSRSVEIAVPLLTLTLAVPSPSVEASQSVTFNSPVLTATLALPDVVVGTGTSATVSPDLLLLTATLQSAAVATEQSVALNPAMLTATVTLLDTAVGLSATVEPPLLTTSLSLLDVALTTEQSVTVAPAMLALAVTLLDATVSTGTSVTLTPAMLTATLTVLAPAVEISGSVTVAPPILTLSLAQLDATIAAERSVIVEAPTIALTLTLADTTVIAARTATIEPAAVMAVLTVLDATVDIDSGADIVVAPPMLLLSFVLPGAVAGFVPTVNGPTEALIVASGTRSVILITTGISTAIVLATGEHAAVLITTGVRTATIAADGEQQAILTTTGARTASVLDDGHRTALIAA